MKAQILALYISLPNITMIRLENLYITNMQQFSLSHGRDEVRPKLMIILWKGIAGNKMGYSLL